MVAAAADRLGIVWPVIADREFALWRLYEPHGWPALFVWGQGGALRWYHLGEGDYAGTEDAIRSALAGSGNGHEWPPLVEPIRLSDAPDAKVIPPTPEIFPGGSTEEPWPEAEADRTLELAYEAGGAYVATEGDGEIDLSIDGRPTERIRVTHPGLQELTSHERTEAHTLRLESSPGLLIYSIQFAAGVPPRN